MGVEPNRFEYIGRNLKNKHDLEVSGGKKGVRPCTCLCIDSIFTWIVTRPCGLPDKIRDQSSRHHTQMHFKCTHFWITDFQIARSWSIKIMQSCSAMFNTSSQSFQRRDNQEVHAISCFFSEADEMQYICAH